MASQSMFPPADDLTPDDKALVPVGKMAMAEITEADLADMDLMIPGFDNMTREDVGMPRRKLVQQIDADEDTGKKAGHFFDLLSGASKKEMTVVVMQWAHGRVYFVKGQEKPLCGSLDNRSPRPDIGDPIQHTCAGCPMREWTTDDTGANVQPCGDVHTYLMADYETGEFFMFSARRTAIAAAKNLNGLIIQSAKDLRTGKTNMFRNAYVLFADKKEKEGKKWHQLCVKRGPVLAPAEQLHYANAAAGFRDTFKTEAMREMDTLDENGQTAAQADDDTDETGQVPF